ncbi:MAG: SpoIIIAH-like family protein [Bacilli bacterium]
MNKQNLWFLTLFSLMLVLSIYYITMPNELLLTNNEGSPKTKKVSGDADDNAVVEIYESEVLVALRVEKEEEIETQLSEFKQQLTNSDSTTEEKNNAFEGLKELNMTKSKEEGLETKIKENYKMDSMVKIDGDQVRVIIASTAHDATIANNIMKTVQEEFETKMYISVKFQK